MLMKKITIFILAAVAAFGFTACNQADQFQYGKEIVLVTGTDYSPISADKILADKVPISYNFSVSSTGVASEDIKVHFKYDTLALQQYNTRNKTSYVAVPQDVILINDEHVVISKGSATSPLTSVTMLDNSFIKEGVNYVIPISVAYLEGGAAQIQEGSNSVFIKVAKTMETYSLNIDNTSVYSTWGFKDGYELNNFTLEIKCMPYSLKSKVGDICRLGAWRCDAGGQFLLRFNENGRAWKALDIVPVSGNHYVTATTGEGASKVGNFEENKWYLISLVYDGSTFSVYINGVKDEPSENGPSGDQSFKFNRFELGMSWGGYNGSQSFNGRVAEMRVWNIARSQSEIASTLCSADPKAAGLVGYWKFNEGEGHVFHDSVAGNDMDWSKSENDPSGHDPDQYSPNPSAANNVHWVKDEKNKCAQ